jgi:hypothetical protein
MKSTVIRLILAFAAGAGCATVLAGGFPTAPPPITVDEFQQRSIALIAEAEKLGYYVGSIEDDRVGLFIDPIACVPNPPLPKLPAGAGDPRNVRKTLNAVEAINEALILGEEAPVYEIGKCKPMR